MTYVNYGSVTAIGVIFPVLALIAWSLRVRVWVRHAHKTEIDDILVIPAVLLVVAGGVALIYGAQRQLVGGNFKTGIEGEASLVQQHVEIFEISFFWGNVVSIGFARLAILFFFRRLFTIPSGWTSFDVANWGLIAFVALWMFCMVLTQGFLCGTHIAGEWHGVNGSDSTCVDTFAFFCASAVISWTMDLALLIEPLVVIGRLKLRFERKVEISLIFTLAILAVAAGLVKMIIVLLTMSFNFNSPPKTELGLPLDDVVGLVSIIIFWNYIEIGVGCLVACLLPCRRYFGKLSTKILSLGPWTIISSNQSSNAEDDFEFEVVEVVGSTTQSKSYN